jgi:hypothetical protein
VLFLFMLIDAGFFLRTHDFLQPLEKPGASPEDETSSLPQQPPPQPVVKQHALPLPGGVGTFSIRPAPVVKAEQHALPLPGGVGTFSIRPAPVVKAEPPLVLCGQPTTQPGGRGAFFFSSSMHAYVRYNRFTDRASHLFRAYTTGHARCSLGARLPCARVSEYVGTCVA